MSKPGETIITLGCGISHIVDADVQSIAAWVKLRGGQSMETCGACHFEHLSGVFVQTDTHQRPCRLPVAPVNSDYVPEPVPKVKKKKHILC